MSTDEKMFKVLPTTSAIVALLLAASSLAETTETSYSPYVGGDYPSNVYFGDTHLHNSISLDGIGDGNTTVGPNEAYRWARVKKSPPMTAC